MRVGRASLGDRARVSRRDKERTRSGSGRVLLIDAGNSRLKWALLPMNYRRGSRFARHGVVDRQASGIRRTLGRLLQSARAPGRVLVCNVAGASFERQLRAAARAAGVGGLEFAHTAPAGAGVRNAYAEPWRLGVDRWVALIGAHHEYPRQAVCIVSVGTAMTVDLLASNGHHLGGCIVPGPTMMIDALLERTAGIRSRAGAVAAAGGTPGSTPAATRSMFAQDTSAGLAAGARHACAALIERAYVQARSRLRMRPHLVLAGGAATAVSSLLSMPITREDQLVLRGLAVLAGAER
jgi:type III pantothenate kinase